jgi:predicted nucleic acid-binding protein
VYLPEAGSLDLDRAFYGRTDLILSDLAVTEVASAVARRCREGVMKPVAAKAVVARILREQESGVFTLAQASRGTHRAAERLLTSLAVPLRAGDALHLALALQEGATLVVTYDERLAAAAVAAGLGVWPTRR